MINFYNALKDGKINLTLIRKYLEAEGAQLLLKGESHYYDIKERFNISADPLDFLFINRSCFNGMIRFNRKVTDEQIEQVQNLLNNRSRKSLGFLTPNEVMNKYLNRIYPNRQDCRISEVNGRFFY